MKTAKADVSKHPYIVALNALHKQQEARESLAKFIPLVFNTVSPEDKYHHNWHIDCMAEYLEAVYRREVTRLIINIPPRNMKSISVAVAWPAWCQGQNPKLRFLAASYSQGLAYQHSMDCRDVVDSLWYKSMFPETRIDPSKASVQEYMTTERGRRFATSVGGSSTGRGGDFLIVDDPHNPLQAESDQQRQKAIDWYDKTFSTRLNNKKTGGIVIVMQRLHQLDLTGHLLEKGGWEHLKLPAECEKRTVITVGSFEKVREEGDLLHPEREGRVELDRAKKDLGEFGYSGQYQQNPVPVGGGVIKKQWARWYKELPRQVRRLIHVWDTGFKDKQQNSYSALTIWQEADTGYYLREAWRDKLLYPDLKAMVKTFYDRDKPHAVVMEEKASGIALIEEMRRSGVPIIAVQAEQDKILRGQLTTPLWESGQVNLPDPSLGHEWLHDYLTEIFMFPKSAFDDWFDSTSHALNYLRGQAGDLDDFVALSDLESAGGMDDDT